MASSSTIFEKALADTAVLVEPVRFVANEIRTHKGENLPSSVARTSAEEMHRYFEAILDFTDKHAIGGGEDEADYDPHTEPEIRGPYSWFDTFYDLDDLTYQLHPRRAEIVFTNIFSVFKPSDPDYSPPHGSKVRKLAELLNATCRNDLSCAYRARYPHVHRSGPVLLSPLFIKFLTEFAQIAAVEENAIETLIDTLSDAVTDPTSGKRVEEGSQICVCCLLRSRARGYLEGGKLVTPTDAGSLKGIKLLGVEEGEHIDGPPVFSPTIKLCANTRAYDLGANPLDRYEIRIRDGEYEVEKKRGGNFPVKLVSLLG